MNMDFIKDNLKEILRGAGIHEEIKIEYPSDFSHGDYSTNIAMEFAKRDKKPPRKLAEEIIKKIKKPDWIEKIEVAGAGFINFFLSPKFLTDFTGVILKEGAHFGESKTYKGQTVVTDTSHPNVAKPMGVHHLLSTIIGSALNNMFAAVGYSVIRDNYIGDWGTQFGKLIYAIKKWGDQKLIEKNPIPELLKLYVRFHEEAEKTAGLDDEGREEFLMLESGDHSNRQLWKKIVDWSLVEFHQIYERLNVSFDVIHGESFYEDKMKEIIDMGIAKRVFVEGEGGALIAPLRDPKKPPCIIRKSDGATLYATRDLARIQYWEKTWKPNLMVNVVDMAQKLYFEQLFEVAQDLQLTDAANLHVTFGRMRFPEKKMSTRKGNIVLMEEVLDEAEERARKIVEEKNPELDAAAMAAVARAVGIGAVKYAVLGQNRMTDVTFTWEKILSLDGNSAPYLQYVYARGRSILRKSVEVSSGKIPASAGMTILKEPQELAVARLLPKFPEVVLLAAEECKPNLIANYLFELASRFNAFYASVPVLKADGGPREARLRLVEAVAVTIENGLKLLGIEAPEEM